MTSDSVTRRVFVTDGDLAAVVEHSPIAMAVATAADGILELNRALTQLTGYSAQELLGRRLIYTVVHPDDVEEVRWVGEAVMERGEAVEVRHRTLTKSGEVRFVRGSIAPMTEPGGPVRWAIAQYVDETELVAASEALEQSRDAFRAFAQTVAHDLRTPLTAIGGFAELLSDSVADRLSEDERRILQTIERSSVRAADQVAHALANAASAHRVIISAFPLAEVIEQVRELLSPQLMSTSGDLVLVENTTVVSDRQIVFDVLLNLIQNSLKYRGEETPTIVVSPSPADRTIRVTDNGRGIPPDHWSRIFETATKVFDSDDGLGLGLARCRHLIESLGGRLYVESSDEDGTTLVISLANARR
jgi:PAS domain S-box-containing protein